MRQSCPRSYRGVGAAPLLHSAPFSCFATSRCSRIFYDRCTTSSAPRRTTVTPRAIDTSTEKAIEKIDRNYCDDFVCTSSPAVELSVRSFVRDLERSRFTPRLFANDTTYADAFRRFTGNAVYTRPTWVMETIKNPRVTIQKVQMLDKANAQIDWQLTGQMGMAPLDISLTSLIEMNLVTGRILSHKESWDLSRVPTPLRLMISASRASWSAKQAGKDTQEGLSKVADSISSLGSTDEDSNTIYRDPTDPTKFFQQNDSNYNDMLSFAIIMVAMYAVFQGFSAVITL